MNTEDILSIANWAVNLTRTAIPVSSNLPNPKQPLSHRTMSILLSRRRAETPEQQAFHDEISRWNVDLTSDKERYPLNASEFYVKSFNRKMTFREISEELAKLPDVLDKPRDFLRRVEVSAVKALKYGIGNCGETSSYAFLLLTEYPENGLPGLPVVDKKIPIERIAFPGEDDHAFLILNRNKDDPKINLHDVSSWNDDTVICDPWVREVYTKKQLFENKNEAEIKAIINKFKNVTTRLPTSYKPFYLGENHNDKIHSDDWEQKHTGQKYWRPKRLYEVVQRPEMVEKLPDYEVRYEVPRLKILKSQYKKNLENLTAIMQKLETMLNELPDQINHNDDSALEAFLQYRGYYNEAKKEYENALERYNNELVKDKNNNKIINGQFIRRFQLIEKRSELLLKVTEALLKSRTKFDEYKRQFLESLAAHPLDYSTLKSKLQFYDQAMKSYLNDKKFFVDSLSMAMVLRIVVDQADILDNAKISKLRQAIVEIDDSTNEYYLSLNKFQEACRKFDKLSPEWLENSYYQLSLIYEEIQKSEQNVHVLCAQKYPKLDAKSILQPTIDVEQELKNRKLLLDQYQEEELEKKSYLHHANDDLFVSRPKKPETESKVANMTELDLRDDVELKLAQHLKTLANELAQHTAGSEQSNLINHKIDFYNQLKLSMKTNPTTVVDQIKFSIKLYENIEKSNGKMIKQIFNFFNNKDDPELKFLNDLVDFAKNYISHPSDFRLNVSKRSNENF